MDDFVSERASEGIKICWAEAIDNKEKDETEAKSSFLDVENAEISGLCLVGHFFLLHFDFICDNWTDAWQNGIHLTSLIC